MSTEPGTPERGRKGRWWMWWLIGIGGGLLLLVLIPFVGGMLMAPGFRSVASISLARPPAEVWAALLDHQKHPLSASMCRASEPLESTGDLPAWREDIGSSRVRVRTIAADAPRRLVREVSDEVVPMSMRVEYTLTPTASGTRLQITAEGEVRSGTWHVPFFRFMIRAFDGIGSGQRAFLKSIAATLGDAAVPS